MDPGANLCHLLCLAPNVEVGMDKHHDGADGAARLEEQDPRAVEEEEHGEAELHAVPKRADVVDPVVQRLPQPVLHIVPQSFCDSHRARQGQHCNRVADSPRHFCLLKKYQKIFKKIRKK
jgi:hypothetical protein